MIVFKPYTNIKDFLHRFTIFKLGKLHIRIHKITSPDQSNLYHNHPFHYISVILKGGYTERTIKGNSTIDRSYKPLSIIVRNRNVFHRIETLNSETITLFIAFGDYGWKAHNPNPNNDDDGLYQRKIGDRLVWSKKENGIWFIGNENESIALNETRHSIHQIL